MYYEPAVEPICDYLTGDIDHQELLLRRRAVLDSPVAKEWGAQRNQSCGQAIRAIAGVESRLLLDDISVKPAMGHPPKLIIGGVYVRVRPELFLIRSSNGEDWVDRGYLKLYFSKNEPLTAEMGEYIAAIVHRYAEMRLAAKGGCDRALCRVLDVFAGKHYFAPKAVKRKREDIVDACHEIETMWPTI